MLKIYVIVESITISQANAQWRAWHRVWQDLWMICDSRSEMLYTGDLGSYTDDEST